MGKLDADVLICWEHHHIPTLASAFASTLGVLPPLPPHATLWPEDDYWSALVCRRTSDGYGLTVTSEDVLPGDPSGVA